ncbi:unnamed protein product [Peronospora destructor]|uniref:Uncharacterized protein n=1 Tax=Peronospora destructor TaxID=86335 RepID=A0AAV0U9W1_9STRA|nr:unnamed protein product [Peronospora destructor]
MTSSSMRCANKAPATPNVAGARGHPRAASSSAASAAGGSSMDVDLRNRASWQSSIRLCAMKCSGSSDESEYSSRGSNRSRSNSYDASAQHEDVSRRDDADDSSRSHRSRSNPSDCGDRSASYLCRHCARGAGS